jgi:hypothetical protein
MRSTTLKHLRLPFTRWIEHYPPDGPYAETFAEVTFTPDPHKGLPRPQWHALRRADVERLIGEPLPEGGQSNPQPLQL